MRKSSRTTLGLLLAVFLLTSCMPKEYNGFKISKQNGAYCIELPTVPSSAVSSDLSEISIIKIPLSFYLVSEAHLKNFTDIYNGFNIEADDTIAFYENIASLVENWDSSLVLEEDRKSFERWKAAGKSAEKSSASVGNVFTSESFVKKYAESMGIFVGILKKLSRQDPLLNTSFTAEDFFNSNARTREVKEAASFVEQFYPGVKIISEFSERTRFVIDESKYVAFPVAATINKEGEATLIRASKDVKIGADGSDSTDINGDASNSNNLRSFEMPVMFYEKLHSLAKKMAKNYNNFSKTDQQIVTELFESCSELRSLTYNLLDFFPTDSDKDILLEWLRYIVSLDREDALFLTGGLAAFCRAQWLYSYRIISVLDDINWNCNYYENETEAVKKTWNDYVNKNQNLIDAIAFYERSFPDIAFRKDFYDKIQ